MVLKLYGEVFGLCCLALGSQNTQKKNKSSEKHLYTRKNYTKAGSSESSTDGYGLGGSNKLCLFLGGKKLYTSS